MGWDLWAAVFLVAGTAIQAFDALAEVRHTRGPAIEVWDTEEALLRELPWWRRPRARRVLLEMREPEIHRDLQHVNRVLRGWAAIFAASVLTLVHVLAG